MKITPQQEEIISTDGDIKINAVAGSGKTATLLLYAKSRPSKSRILYLSFNRTIKLEATQKFASAGLTNITCETANSLALRNLARKEGIKITDNGSYKISELSELLSIKSVNGEQKIIALQYIEKAIALFCNSTLVGIEQLNMSAILDEPDLTDENLKSAVIDGIIEYWEKMDGKEIKATHDYCLKKFQLSKPILNYDYILLDEGQDSSPAILDIFMRQKAKKIIVGDTHQQIYSWRYAQNALKKVNYQTFSLNKSFRFNEKIADLANRVLEWKNLIGQNIKADIIGAGQTETEEAKAMIARTNAGLLKMAIDWAKESKGKKKLMFEGNFSSYTYGDAGASIYDLVNFIGGKKAKVKNSAIKGLKDLAALNAFIRKTNDTHLKHLLDLVLEHGEQTIKYFNVITANHIDVKKGETKEDAEMIFTTVHRSKGMEYDVAHLADDFINEAKAVEMGEKDVAKADEEINLLYVAITRAKNRVFIPHSILPFGFVGNDKIIVVEKVEKKESKPPPENFKPELVHNETPLIEQKENKIEVDEKTSVNEKTTNSTKSIQPQKVNSIAQNKKVDRIGLKQTVAMITITIVLCIVMLLIVLMYGTLKNYKF
jgi:DNA-binding protein Fis